MDPFERAQRTTSRKTVYSLYLPLALTLLLTLISLYWSWQSVHQIRYHPECACRHLLNEQHPSRVASTVRYRVGH